MTCCVSSRNPCRRGFRGHLTYEYGGQMDSLVIVHGLNNGVEQERILHLSGPAREAVRQGRLASCVNAGSFLLRGGFASNNSRVCRLASTRITSLYCGRGARCRATGGHNSNGS